MIEGLKPYAEYKESGSRWIGSVPSSWTVRNLRTLITSRSERNHPDLPLLSVAREKGVFVRSLTDANENHNVIPEDLTNYKVARAGNLVINKMKAWQGSMGIAPCDGIVSPAYFVFDFRIANHAFGQALLRCKPYVGHFGQASDGVRIGQWDLSIPGMRQIPVLVPSEDEQAAIVRFLDHANRKINRFIHTKRRLIELLNEEKQFIIRRAGTHGIDPNVKLKPSGINLLGDVPEHWGIHKLKRLTTQIVDGTHFTPKYTDKGVPFLRVKDIHSNTLEMETLRYISFDEHLHLNKRCNPEKGDVLLSKNGTIGITKVVDWDFQFSIFVSLCLIKLRKNLIDPYFLSYIFKGRILDEQIRDTTKTTSVTNLHLDKINNFVVIVPSIEEQRMIIEHLRVILLSSDQAIERTRSEIALIREYRNRLISDVVTGKLDVRSVELPTMDEAEVPEDIEIGEETEAEELIESEEVPDADE